LSGTPFPPLIKLNAIIYLYLGNRYCHGRDHIGVVFTSTCTYAFMLDARYAPLLQFFELMIITEV